MFPHPPPQSHWEATFLMYFCFISLFLNWISNFLKKSDEKFSLSLKDNERSAEYKLLYPTEIQLVLIGRRRIRSKKVIHSSLSYQEVRQYSASMHFNNRPYQTVKTLLNQLVNSHSPDSDSLLRPTMLAPCHTATHDLAAKGLMPGTLQSVWILL